MLTPTRGLNVELAGSLTELEELEQPWADLWNRCPNTTPFSHPAWQIPWFRNLGEGELITLALYGDGEFAAHGSTIRNAPGSTDFSLWCVEAASECEEMERGYSPSLARVKLSDIAKSRMSAPARHRDGGDGVRGRGWCGKATHYGGTTADERTTKLRRSDASLAQSEGLGLEDSATPTRSEGPQQPAPNEAKTLLGLAPLYIYTERDGTRKVFFIGIGTSDYLGLIAEAGWEPRLAEETISHLWAPQSSMLNHQSSIVNPQSSTLNPQPSIINHQSSILNPRSSTINPQSSTLNPQSSTLNPQSSTLNHQFSPPWDLIEFSCLEPSSTLYEMFKGHAMPCDVCPTLDLASGAIETSVPKGMLNKLRYYRRRISKAGQLDLIRAERENVLELFEILVKLHAERWSEKNGSGVLSDPRVVRHHRESLPKMLQAGLLHMFILTLEGAPLAVYYGFIDRARRKCYSYIGGFDPEKIMLSPGRLMIGQAIDDAVEAGVQTFDFLRGSEPYKYAWGAKDRVLFRVSLDPLSVRVPLQG